MMRRIFALLVTGSLAASACDQPAPTGIEEEAGPEATERVAMSVAATVGGTAKLTPSDGASGNQFGYAVGIAGDLALAGAPFHAGGGAAYLYRGSGGSWTQEAKVTHDAGGNAPRFGAAVATDEGRALVGAYGDVGRFGSGAAYVFADEGAGWKQVVKLIPSDAMGQDFFGWAVALSGDLVLVGSPQDDDRGSMSGSAYVYDAADWAEAKLVPADGSASDLFGRAVAIQGDMAIVGAPFDDDAGSDAGSAYLFRRAAGVWAQEAKLTADDAQPFDYFGDAVAVRGDVALVGARRDDHNGTDAGSAYVFRRTAEGWVQEAKLTAAEGVAGDELGTSVALGTDFAMVGAPFQDAAANNAGAAYLFRRDGSEWVQEARIVADGSPGGHNFGRSVAIATDLSLLGAPGAGTGAAYVFDLGPFAPDADGDGIADSADNCPAHANADQADADGDGVGDACDNCPNDPDNDADGDGVCGDVDNAPDVANPDQADEDADGVSDVVDNCPTTANADQADEDGDGIGDICDTPDPLSATQALITLVQDLAAEKTLAARDGKQLLSKLEAVQKSIAKGRTTAAMGQLGAFANQVGALVKSRRLPAAKGEELIEGADGVARAIEEAAEG